MNINVKDPVDLQKNGTPKLDRILRKKEVKEITGCSSATLYRWARDPDNPFPNLITIGPRTSGWSEKSIAEWLEKVSVQGGSL